MFDPVDPPPFPTPPAGGFSLIYADPPWPYRDKANAGQRGAAFKYPPMKLNAICALPVSDIAADNAVLVLWWVPPQPAEALAVMDAWGFRLINMLGFTWIKKTSTGKNFFGMGHWTRGNAECCLIAKRGKITAADHSISQLVEAERREHSRKPDEIRDKAVQLVGDVPRIELFARQAAPGWVNWGNEL